MRPEQREEGPSEAALDPPVARYLSHALGGLEAEGGGATRLQMRGRIKVGDEPWFTREETSKYTDLLEEYTRLGNPLGDHPDMRRVPGIDFSSGSLGHALSAGLGMALGGRLQGLDFRVFVLLGDGELHEGQVWEAAMSAAHHKATNLIAIVDRNEYSLDGRVEEVIGVEPLLDKWRAFGWDAHEVDGHDVAALLATLRGVADGTRERPTAVVAHTVKGKGLSFMEEDFGWHLGYLMPEDEADALTELRGSA